MSAERDYPAQIEFLHRTMDIEKGEGKDRVSLSGSLGQVVKTIPSLEDPIRVAVMLCHANLEQAKKMLGIINPAFLALDPDKQLESVIQASDSYPDISEVKLNQLYRTFINSNPHLPNKDISPWREFAEAFVGLGAFTLDDSESYRRKKTIRIVSHFPRVRSEYSITFPNSYTIPLFGEVDYEAARNNTQVQEAYAQSLGVIENGKTIIDLVNEVPDVLVSPTDDKSWDERAQEDAVSIGRQEGSPIFENGTRTGYRIFYKGQPVSLRLKTHYEGLRLGLHFGVGGGSDKTNSSLSQLVLKGLVTPSSFLLISTRLLLSQKVA